MTLVDTPRMTLPRVKKPPRWQVGESLVVGRRRWIVRFIQGDDVELVAANTTNHGIGWNTTLDKLPEKTA